MTATENLKDDQEKILNLDEAAQYMKVTRQAVGMAIKHNKLKATLKNGKWIVTEKDLDHYRMNKYVREHSLRDGELLFDPSKGELSVLQTAKLLGYKIQRVYYLLHTGQIRASKKGCAWVIHKDEVQRVYEEYYNELNKHIKLG